ncbi:peptidylglycine alpha-hydroxylating monooxygenase [Hetaerina americana]|uniref:peptidylglycine alpha-hydroxylating monooxygenase n=1 Tax=Hetaerina americana TaxID=62018 RepID=UPI003A7F4E74
MGKSVVSLLFYLTIVFTNILRQSYSYKVEKYSLLMPNVRPSVPELYLCTPIKIDSSKNFYIVGFEPNATMDTAHHMLLYGCTTPGSKEAVWNCGEMVSSVYEMKASSPCRVGSQVIYAWARDAPKLDLPEGVGFRVGGDSPIQYLVLQIHYAHIDKFKDGSTDNSGIFLHYTERPLDKLAGVILLGTGGSIQPMHKEHMETSCVIRENKVIHPFAYRTHTHSLGKVVAGYKVSRMDDGTDVWTLLGKRDPLTPQMFYPVMNNITVGYGDMLAARCTMESNRERWTHVGPTNNDEMCNFYLMYWVEKDSPLERKYCFTLGPPKFSWSASNGLNNIPEIEASSL